MDLWREMDEAGGLTDEEGRPIDGFRERLAADPVVRRHLDPEALAACFDPEWYLRNAGVIFERLGL
jgi:adenylosuccinate lyase